MKYILEIKPEYEANGIMILGARDSHLYVTTLEVKDLEELNSEYINEHFGDLQDTAYQRGLEDAWEAAKKIFGYEIDGGIPLDEIGKVFGYAEDAIFCTADIIRHNSASEAIAKLKAYEEKQKEDDKIEVGDEVIYNGTTKCIVVRPEDDERYASLFDSDGAHYSADHRECKKTGRHFDIDKILEEMKA